MMVLTVVPQDANIWVIAADASGELGFESAPFASAARKLIETGDIPETHLILIPPDRASSAEIEKAIGSLAGRMKKGDRLILLFRGMIDLPGGSSREVFLIGADGVRMTTRKVNGWLSKLPEGPKTLILDCYTRIENLFVFYAARRTFGTSALVFVDHPSQEDAFLKLFEKALDDERLDSNGDRKVTALELYEAILRGGEFPGISALTGEPSDPILMFPSAISIESDPPGAKAFVDGREVGETPCLAVGPRPGLHEVRVEKELYLIPQARMVRVGRWRGELVKAPTFKLKPIKITGRAILENGEPPPKETYVYIDGTGYMVKVDEKGRFAFERWSAGLPKPGDYKLVAEHSDTMIGEARIRFGGYSDIEVEIKMKHRPWEEVSRMRFERGDELGSAEAFEEWARSQKGPILRLPDLDPKHAELLLGYFADKAERATDELLYQLVSALLSDRLERADLAKRYWRRVKLIAPKGSPERELAERRLRELYRLRRYLTFGAAAILVALIASGTFLVLRRRSTRPG